jgi:hypothetical protein
MAEEHDTMIDEMKILVFLFHDIYPRYPTECFHCVHSALGSITSAISGSLIP